MKQIQTDLNIDSDALKANLLETAEYVEIRPDLLLLLDIVKKYRGIHSSLESLLYEICHPYRNWQMLVPPLRSFVLKNFNHYVKHEQGPEAFELFGGLFFEAIDDSARNTLLVSQIFEALCGWLDKVISQFNGGGTQAL